METSFSKKEINSTETKDIEKKHKLRFLLYLFSSYLILEIENKMRFAIACLVFIGLVSLSTCLPR